MDVSARSAIQRAEADGAGARGVCPGSGTDHQSDLRSSTPIPAPSIGTSSSPTAQGTFSSSSTPVFSSRSVAPRPGPGATALRAWTTHRQLQNLSANNTAQQWQAYTAYPANLPAALPAYPPVSCARPLRSQGALPQATAHGVEVNSGVQTSANIPKGGECHSSCVRGISPPRSSAVASSFHTSFARREPPQTASQVSVPSGYEAALASAPASLLAAASARSVTNGFSSHSSKPADTSESRPAPKGLPTNDFFSNAVPLRTPQQQVIHVPEKVESNPVQTRTAPPAHACSPSNPGSSTCSVASAYLPNASIYDGHRAALQSPPPSPHTFVGSYAPNLKKTGNGSFASTSSMAISFHSQNSKALVRPSSVRTTSNNPGFSSCGTPADSVSAPPKSVSTVQPTPDAKSLGSASCRRLPPFVVSNVFVSPYPFAISTPAGQLKLSLSATPCPGTFSGAKARHAQTSSASSLGSQSPSEVLDREAPSNPPLNPSQGRPGVAMGENREGVCYGSSGGSSSRSSLIIQSGCGSSSRAPIQSLARPHHADKANSFVFTGAPIQSNAGPPLFRAAAAHGEKRPSGHTTPASEQSVITGVVPPAYAETSAVHKLCPSSPHGVVAWSSSTSSLSSEVKRDLIGGQRTPTSREAMLSSSASPVNTVRSVSKRGHSTTDRGGILNRLNTSNTVSDGKNVSDKDKASGYERRGWREPPHTGGSQGRVDGCCPRLWTMTAEDLFGLDITSTCRPQKAPELSRLQKDDQAASAINRLLEAEADAALVIKRAEGLRSALLERMGAELEDEERRFRDHQEKIFQQKKQEVSEELEALQAKNTSEAEAFVESIHVGLDERRVAAVDQIIDLTLKVDVSCPLEVVKRFGTRRQLLELAMKTQESPRQIVHHPPGDTLERDTDVITWDEEGHARVEHKSASTHQRRVTDMGSFWVRHQSKVHQHSNRPLVLLSTHSWQEDDDLEGAEFPRLGSILEPSDSVERGKSSFL